MLLIRYQSIICIVVSVAFTACNKSQSNNNASAAGELPLSLQMAQSEMQRTPHAVNLDFRPTPRWNYSAGLELCAMWQTAQQYDNQSLREYVYSYADSLIADDGTIFGYRGDEYNLDNVNAGKLLLALIDATGEQRFQLACDTLRRQIASHPRTAEGGFWHKQVYEHQMWLDGLYMGAPYLLEYAQRTGEDVSQDVLRQFQIVGNHTFDSSTNLYRHAWDESHSQFWADSSNGQSQHAWGRANGWYMMAMVDVLAMLPDSVDGRDALLTRFRNLTDALQQYRDTATGMWFQVLDAPYREGNYLESSASAMFVYAMLKGSRLGFLDEQYKDVAIDAYRQFCECFVRCDDDGTISVTSCCAVAGLGGKNRRDGSYQYYLSEPVRDNDPKTVGPFIMASLEVEGK